MLKKLRTIVAVVFFIGISLLFLDFTGTVHRWLGWMAKVQFLPAALALNVGVVAALVALTLLFGRVYCSAICPLGIMQDLIARMRRKKNKYSYSKAVSWLRYSVLAVMVAAIVLGISVVVQLLAPYSSFGRIVTSIFQPLWMWGNNVLASLAERVDSYAFYSADVWLRSLPVLIVAAVTLLGVGFLAWKGGRTYCNTICPVGTLLGLLSKFSFFKVRFDADKCRNCSACSRRCKASCIDYKTHSVDYSRCVACGNCLSACKFGALHYAPATARGKKTEENVAPARPDSGRRAFLLATALASTAVIAQEKKKVDGGLAVIEDKKAPTRTTPLVPPGAISADNMAKHCTGCQLCVAECPNQVLRPSTDMMHLMQPVMSYERGYCRPECTRCSVVCPAGAIKPISPAEKSSVQVGHAVFIQKNCVAVRDHVDCGNCERHCPAGAIEMVPLDENDDNTPFVPAVDETRCIGCGACENLCPARPFPAIYVEGHEVHRQV